MGIYYWSPGSAWICGSEYIEVLEVRSQWKCYSVQCLGYWVLLYLLPPWNVSVLGPSWTFYDGPKPWILYLTVSGFAIGCSGGVYCRRLTAGLLYGGSFLETKSKRQLIQKLERWKVIFFFWLHTLLKKHLLIHNFLVCLCDASSFLSFMVLWQ